MPLLMCSFLWNWVLPMNIVSDSCTKHGIVTVGSKEVRMPASFATGFIDLFQATETKVKPSYKK